MPRDDDVSGGYGGYNDKGSGRDRTGSGGDDAELRRVVRLAVEPNPLLQPKPPVSNEPPPADAPAPFEPSETGLLPPRTTPEFKPQDASVTGQLNQVLSSDSPLLTQARTRAAQVANRRGLLNSSFATQAGEAAAFDVALPIASQQAGQIHQSNLQGGQIASTERIAASTVSAFEREKATAALAQFDSNYQEAFRTISANETIPAATREKYLTHLSAIRDSNFNLVEQLYNISLVWQSPVV